MSLARARGWQASVRPTILCCGPVSMKRQARSCCDASDGRLSRWGVRLAKRIRWKRASIALARKLAVTMHVVWRDGIEFVWTQAEAAGGPDDTASASAEDVPAGTQGRMTSHRARRLTTARVTLRHPFDEAHPEA